MFINRITQVGCCTSITAIIITVDNITFIATRIAIIVESTGRRDLVEEIKEENKLYHGFVYNIYIFIIHFVHIKTYLYKDNKKNYSKVCSTGKANMHPAFRSHLILYLYYHINKLNYD